jgi:hypothetical protein
MEALERLLREAEKDERLPRGTRLRDVMADYEHTIDAVLEFQPTPKWERAAAKNQLPPFIRERVTFSSFSGFTEEGALRAIEMLVKAVEREWRFLTEHFPGVEPKP